MTFARLSPARTVVAAAAACLTVGAVLATPAAAATPPPSPWLQTGYNAAGSNANLAESTLSTGNVAKLKLLRTIKADSDQGCGVGVDSVAFSESRVYTTSDDTLTARNLYTGAVLWSTKNIAPDDNVFSQIAVSHGLVLVSGNECGTNDPEAYVEAFNSSTGKEVWSHSYGDGISGFEVSGSYVVAHVKLGLESDPLTEVYRVLDGKVAWTTKGHESTYCDAQTHVVYGLVFVDYCGSGGSKELRALALATGKFVWKKAGDYAVLGGDSDTSSAHHAFVNDNDTNAVLDLNPKTGATRYTLSIANGPFVAADQSRVYIGCGVKEFPICAYNIADGTGLWENDLTDPNSGPGGEANGVLYLNDGTVLNAATGKSIGTGLPHTGTVKLIGDGRVGVITAGGDLAIYGL